MGSRGAGGPRDELAGGVVYAAGDSVAGADCVARRVYGTVLRRFAAERTGNGARFAINLRNEEPASCASELSSRCKRRSAHSFKQKPGASKQLSVEYGMAQVADLVLTFFGRGIRMIFIQAGVFAIMFP